jgi:Spy/CpxP family protein refolding chaperone
MKKVLLVFTLMFATAALAQDDLGPWLQMMKQDLKAQKKDVITKGMQTFTSEEAKRFWPIYDAYNRELENFLDARVALLKAYADDFDKMTDAKATDLLNRRLNIQRQRTKLDDKYREQFATALSPRRLVRFYQIEHQLELMVELQAVSQIPMMKWW